MHQKVEDQGLSEIDQDAQGGGWAILEGKDW